MKRLPLGFLLCLLGLLVTIGFAGCGGTETGNPGGGGGRGDGNPAVELGGALCDKLTDCFGEERDFTRDYCVWALSVSNTLGPAFGVEEEPAPEYGQVIVRVENRDLSADDDALTECLDAIDSLQCGAPEVQAVDIAAGFTNVEEMVPEASCSEVF